MAERLDYVRHEPACVLDAGFGAGAGLRLLGRRYPKAKLVGVDAAPAVVRQAATGRTVAERARSFFGAAGPHCLCADMARLPLARASVGMVWSNLALGWSRDPLMAFREFHRVLDVGGLVMFSTYGPDTLKELRQAFADADDGLHVHSFIDMHDLGDMLVVAGFAAPVMDMEHIALTYSGVDALVRDLRLSGQSNVAIERGRGLMGRRRWQAMVASYERRRHEGRLQATFEIVYGHAWKPQSRTDAAGRQIVRSDFHREKQP